MHVPGSTPGGQIPADLSRAKRGAPHDPGRPSGPCYPAFKLLVMLLLPILALCCEQSDDATDAGPDSRPRPRCDLLLTPRLSCEGSSEQLTAELDGRPLLTLGSDPSRMEGVLEAGSSGELRVSSGGVAHLVTEVACGPEGGELSYEVGGCRQDCPDGTCGVVLGVPEHCRHEVSFTLDDELRVELMPGEEYVACMMLAAGERVKILGRSRTHQIGPAMQPCVEPGGYAIRVSMECR